MDNNDSDGYDEIYSADSCDAADLAEQESHLYSLIHHSADHMESTPSTLTEKPSPDLRINPFVSLPNTSIQSDSMNASKVNFSPNTSHAPVTPAPFHHSASRRASRMNNVHQIINSANKREQDSNLVLHYLKEISKTNQKPDRNQIDFSDDSCIEKNISKSHSFFKSTDIPKAIEKPEVSSQRNPERNMVLNPKSHHFSLNVSSSVSDEPSSLMNSFSFDLSTHLNSTSNAGNLLNISSESFAKQTFRLDNRLFSNAPFNLDSKIQESHNRLFSGKTATCKIKTKIDNVNKNALSSEPLSVSVSNEITVVDVLEVCKKVGKVESVSEDVIILDDIDVSLVKTKKKSTPKAGKSSVTIHKKQTVDPDIIVVSDQELLSDSDESIRVLPLPKRSSPVVFSVDESTDDEVSSMGPPLKRPTPDVELEPQDNSFDFLDNAYDVDALAKSQARLLCNLIGSKESLIDERLFQTETSPNKKNSPNKTSYNNKTSLPMQSLPKTPVSSKKTMERHSSKLPEIIDTSSPQRNKTPDISIIETPKPPKSELKCINVTSEHLHVISTVASPLEVGDINRPSTNAQTLIKRRKTPNQASNKSSPKCVVPTLNIAPDLRDAILNYIVARSSGPVQSNGINCSVADRMDEDPNADENYVAMSEDIMAVHSGTMADNSAIDEILQDTAGVASFTAEQRAELKLDRKARKRMQRRESRRANLPEPLYRPTSSVVYTRIHGEAFVDKRHKSTRQPRKWTALMRRFYDDSWGGEQFDVDVAKSTMSSNPSLWQVNSQDRYRSFAGRRSGNVCLECRGPHHMLSCPYRTPACIMCGERGHRQDNCPNSICLECGQPSPVYVISCQWCEGSHHGDCATCVWRHDPAKPCRPAAEGPRRPNEGYQPSAPKIQRSSPAMERAFDRRRSAPSNRTPYKPYWKNQFNNGARWSKFDRK